MNHLLSVLLKFLMTLCAAQRSLKAVPDWGQKVNIGKCSELATSPQQFTSSVPLCLFSQKPYFWCIMGTFQRLRMTIFTESKTSWLMQTMTQNIWISILRKFRSQIACACPCLDMSDDHFTEVLSQCVSCLNILPSQGWFSLEAFQPPNGAWR